MAYNEFKTEPPDTLYVLSKGRLYSNEVYPAYDCLPDVNTPEHLQGCEVAIYKLDRVTTLDVPPPPSPVIKFVTKIFEKGK